MSEYIKEYKFEIPPREVKYLDGEPLKLTAEFGFYHNKISIRKELVAAQNLMKNYLGTSLTATGIRDSYLKEEFYKSYFLVIFSTKEKYKEVNMMIQTHENDTINTVCFLIETTSAYMLILAKDLDGISLGIRYMEEILNQTLEDYMQQKKFDDYIKIRPFTLINCLNQ